MGSNVLVTADPGPPAEWYPEMPPKLPGETDGDYTDRLTGADRTGRVPYDHKRFRQCSIGWHGECSDPDGEECECPCHRQPGTEDALDELRTQKKWATMVTSPPLETLAGIARRIVEMHGEWDSLHQFVTILWDGDEISYGTVAAITPSIDPGHYPALMAKIAADDMVVSRSSKAKPYAYALQIEAFRAYAPESDASPAEHAQFERDAAGHTVHERPDAVEEVLVSLADVYGNLWMASERRDQPGKVDEQFFASGDQAVGGRMTQGLLAVAYAAGVYLYDMPLPVSAPRGPRLKAPRSA